MTASAGVQDVFTLPRSDLNAFLFATVCLEASGMALSILSALARAGVDPWQEARRLAQLPRAAAAEALIERFGAVDYAVWQTRDPATVAVGLLALPPAHRGIAAALNGLLADVFALYPKTKNFHWHMSGPHFRDYLLMLDEQAAQVFAMTDVLAERVRKLGRTTLHSISDISRHQRSLDNDASYVTPQDMLAKLRKDNATLATRMRETHGMLNEQNDVATAGIIEVFIDETERRAWFLYESSHVPPHSD